jgi:hypothetical protein
MIKTHRRQKKGTQPRGAGSARGGPPRGAGSAPVAPASGHRRELPVPRFEQPDDVTCGPTCLRQIFHYYGEKSSFLDILSVTQRNPDGGTLAVYLALAALRLGYRAALYPYHLRIFDPTWFELPRRFLKRKLEQRAAVVQEPKLKAATRAYEEFLEQGGRIEFAELMPQLLVRILERRHPVLCGLSSTYLYRRSRERPEDNEDDDVRGEPTGHFVVISGYSSGGKSFFVRDPSSHAPFGPSGRYVVPAQRLINSILLGDATHDAVLLELWPPKSKGPS